MRSTYIGVNLFLILVELQGVFEMLNRRKQIQITFNSAPAIDNNYISSSILTVKSTISKILSEEQCDTHKSYELVRQLVLYHKNKDLLDWVVQQCKQSLTDLDPTNVQHFYGYESKVKKISLCLAYMNTKQANIYTTLLMLYRALLTNEVFDHFMKYKSEQAIQMINQLQCTSRFNEHVLDVLSDHYMHVDVPCSLNEFISFIISTFAVELEIAENYYSEIKAKVHSLLLECLFVVHISIIPKQFDSLFSLSSEQISNFFNLLHDANQMSVFGVYLEDYLIKESSKYLLLPDDQVMQEWIKLMHGCQLMLISSFSWIDHYKKAFQQTINMTRSIGKDTTELLVKYTDSLLRGNIDLPFEQTSDFIILLFRCLQDKDVYIAFYKVYLARRLLLQKSASMDEEKQFVYKMKLEIGSNNTQHLEGMFSDIMASNEESSSFSAMMQSNIIPLPFHFQGTILTSSKWPSYPKQELKLPEQLNSIYSKFMEYHLQKNKMKKIVFVPLLSKTVLVCRFAQQKELICNALQASVLLAIGGNVNDGILTSQSMTFQDLKLLLGLSEPDLKNTLISLMNPKAMIISCTSEVFRANLVCRVLIRIKLYYKSKIYPQKVQNSFSKHGFKRNSRRRCVD
eukprot:NODE_28_length_33831_cov_0.361200.p4 type:complete len:626 gc:universal NODE_28_length_33831_cov_0.361200:21033-19156(-)